MKILHVLSVLCAVSLLQTCASVRPKPWPLQLHAGRVERIESMPSQWVAARPVDIWLPPGYQRGRQYPVLYMHDGQMLFDSSTTWNKQAWRVDEHISKLMALDLIEPTIVVGIWNAGALRHAEYFPQKPFMQLPQAVRDSLLQAGGPGRPTLFAGPVQSDNYLRFIVEELKPLIDRRYATKREAASTFIAGSSMGGLISIYAVCEYPTVFGGAACLSTHWPGTFQQDNNPVPQAFVDYLDARLPPPATHRLYFDRGTEGLDAWYESPQWQVDTLLTAKGYRPPLLQSLTFEGHDHNEQAWAGRLALPMVFLLGKKS
jgi:enterochelin esterase-like enzyme